jgi:hypothetical protein
MVAREEGHNSSLFQHNVSPQPILLQLPRGVLSKINWVSLYTQEDPSNGSKGSKGSTYACLKIPGGNRGEVVGGVTQRHVEKCADPKLGPIEERRRDR